MTTQIKTQDLLARLAAVEGKAEIIEGEIVLMPPTGGGPGYAGGVIFVSLWAFAQRTGHGRAVGVNNEFLVNLPYRSSLSPDAAFYVGPPTARVLEDLPAYIFAIQKLP